MNRRHFLASLLALPSALEVRADAQYACQIDSGMTFLDPTGVPVWRCHDAQAPLGILANARTSALPADWTPSMRKVTG